MEDKAILLPSTADFQVGENGQEPKCPGHWHSTQVYIFSKIPRTSSSSE